MAGPQLPRQYLPIELNEGAAHAYLTRLELAARAIEEAAHERRRGFARALTDWHGGRRDMCQASESELDSMAMVVVAELRAQTRHVRDVVDDVRAENAKRARLRADWEYHNAREAQAARTGRPT